MSTIIDERDLAALTSEIAEHDRNAATAREKADELLATMKADGRNPLTDKDAFAEIDAAYTDADQHAQKAEEGRSRQKAAMAWLGSKRTPDPRGSAAKARPAGFHATVFADPAYAPLTPERLSGNNAIGAMPSVPVIDRDELVARMESGRPWFGATATATLDAGIPLDERLYPPVATLRRQLALLDLVTVGATNSDTVKYARQTTRTSAAAETALGTAYSEASFDFEQVTANVESIGHFTTAYRENIADAAQFDTLIRSQLQEDVMLRLESQILSGDGTGSNLTGILNTSNVQSYDWDSTNERRLVALHKAITLIRVNAFREPTAILLHPNDYQEALIEEISLANAGSAAMFAANLRDGTPASAWGLPIVVSTVATEGTGVVGYWRDATLWVRSGVSLSVSDSHSDYFTKRQVAILAEMRGAFSVQRPAAFCEVTTI